MVKSRKVVSSKNSLAAAVGQLIAGTKKHYPDMKQSITVGGVAMAVGDVTSELQKLVTNRADVVAARAAAKAKVDDEDAQMPALYAFVQAYVAAIKVNFGTKADVLADFGVQPPKARTPQTAEQMAVAAAKRQATREKRGTTGPKAKKTVHGNVTAELVVTPAPATTPAAPPAPAAGSAQTPQK
jgi:hypothetical protein